MKTSSLTEQEQIHLQEGGAQAVIEDRSLPAEQVLSEKDDPEERQRLFVP